MLFFAGGAQQSGVRSRRGATQAARRADEFRPCAGQYGHDRFDFSLPTHSPGVGERDRRPAERVDARARSCAVDELVAHIGVLALGVHRRRAQGLRPDDRHSAERRRARSTTTGAPPTRNDWPSWPRRGGDPAAWQGMTPRRWRRLSRRGGGDDRAGRGGAARLGSSPGPPACPTTPTPPRRRAAWSTWRSSSRRAGRGSCSGRRCRSPDDAPALDRIVAMSGRDPGVAPAP